MERELVGKRPTFHRAKPRTNSYRVMLWLLLIMGAIWLLLQVESGEIKPLLQPTPTPTRQARSYILEAEAYFASGKIDDPDTDKDAIDTYRLALQEDPNNARVWAEMARIMTYSSSLMSTRDQRSARLAEALDAVNRAKELAPEDSQVLAIRAFVLNWCSPYGETEKDIQRYLAEAEQEAYAAITLDPDNGLAQAYYAEVKLDHQKWEEAATYAAAAVERSPDSMDAHRIYGLVLENLGAYNGAIEQYEEAAKINPNLTFLWLRIGVNYRQLASSQLPGQQQAKLYEKALEYFDRAAKINEQNGVKDPLPYIAIAKTYTQMGEFFIASRNAEKALSLNPADANSYGQLGIIYFKSRNYESSLPALMCAVTGCSAEENLVLQRLAAENPNWGVVPVSVQPLPLESIEIAYYYAEYGQVLAYLSRPRKNYCSQAYPILDLIRSSPYGNDEVLSIIIAGSESICRRIDGEASP